MDFDTETTVAVDSDSNLFTNTAPNANSTTMLFSCVIGNALEWYDFVIYGYFAAIFGKLFFPGADHLTQILASWAVFWAGFLARPLGSIIFGHIGDKFSRKQAITLSLFTMAIPTALIGLLPTFNQIGILAPVCLVLLRTLQGLALGGEFTGSLIFVVEHAGKRGGRWGSWIASSAILGIIFGSTLVAGLNISLSNDDMEIWGWRIPFIISVLGSVIGIYMRNNLQDPTVYLEEKAKSRAASPPLKSIFIKYKFELCQIILFDLLTAIGFFMLTVFLVSYFNIYLKVPDNITFTINTINMIIFAMATLSGGWLADYIGARKLAAASCIILMLLSYPLFSLMQLQSYILIFLMQAVFAIIFGIFFGVLPTILVKIMPTQIRYTGLSIGHNCCMAIFGGSMPFVATQLIDITGNTAAPAFMLIIASVVSLSSLYFIKEHQAV